MGIKELAKHLNVSIGTVSRALNGHKEVSDETRRRVLEAAQHLGYEPNQSGRSLRKGSINTVALMLSVDCLGEQIALFFLEMCQGVQNVLGERDINLVIHLNRPEDNMLDSVRKIVERQLADGIILPETRKYDPRLDYLAERKFPFVTLGRSLSGGDHPWIDLDFEGAMAQAMQRLIGLGHRRIAIATGRPGLMLDEVLLESYKRELERNNLPYDPDIVRMTEANEAGGYAVTDWLLGCSPAPTAVIFPHHRVVAGAYRRLAAQGLSAGRDIAIMSCSPDSPMAQYLAPALTCFRLSLRELGESLAEILLAAMHKNPSEQNAPVPMQRLWPWEMIIRESDACGPSEM